MPWDEVSGTFYDDTGTVDYSGSDDAYGGWTGSGTFNPAVDSAGSGQPLYTGSTPSSVTIGGVTYGADSGFNLSNLAKLAGIAGLGVAAANAFGGGGGGSGSGVGTVPLYTATRQQLPIPQTVTNEAGETVRRRPGSGGVTYFSPMQYSYTGVTPQTPQEFLAPYAPPAPAAAPVAAPVAAPAAAPALSIPQDFDVSALATFLGKPTQDVQSQLASPTGIYALLAELLGSRFPNTSSYRSGGSVGISSLGGYSDGGRLLKGPGDGVSDSIPATIGGRQPARLADGEFVVPARIVSELGNGSTDAGARKLYQMMERIKQARKKSNKDIAADTKADKYLPK